MSDPEPSTPEGAPAVVGADVLSGQTLRFYDFVMAAFVAILVLSNVLGAGKVAVVTLPIVGEWPFGVGILFFPVSYVIGDVLTEVYGYARARRVIWAGFSATVFMAFMAWVVVALPPAPDWANQAAYETVFGQVPRIVAASMCAFWAGEFVNSYVLARMKVWSGGRHLWMRTIGSTIAGQGVDSLIFYPLAFLVAAGWTTRLVVTVLFTQWALKVAWEALLTPVTYAVVGGLKRPRVSTCSTRARTSRHSVLAYSLARSAKRSTACTPGQSARSGQPICSSNPSNRRRPSLPPCAASIRRSGCGIMPSTLPAALTSPAISRALPLTGSA